jgi:pyrrolysine biosynthesis protein PylC
MKVVVMGGKLQGVEAAYLARKAGWEVVVIDRHSKAPASGLAHSFIQTEIRSPSDLDRYSADADLILPAIESATLACLREFSGTEDVPVLFDFAAYDLTSSKTASNRFFDKHGIPAPRPWPACGFPLVVKPSRGSGSRAVRVYHDGRHFQLPPGPWSQTHVIQEFVQGPQFSIEVVGRPNAYVALQTTDLTMDSSYDCSRVKTPGSLSPELEDDFQSIARSIAGAINLKGLMDVEAVLHDDQLKVLEIDARLPSQTPTAVWWSSGVNMLELLADAFVSDSWAVKSLVEHPKGVVYEHIRVSRDRLETVGEHAMSQAGALRLQSDFFGADEALTSAYNHGKAWVATLICREATRREACCKRNRVVADLCRHFRLTDFSNTHDER